MTFDFFASADSTEKLFWVFAVFGTLFFLIRVVFAIVGGFGVEDADGGGEGTADDADGSHESDVAFKLISLNSVTGFLMMFGWVGLASYKDHGLIAAQAVLAAFVGGLVTMALTAQLFRIAMNFTSKGSRFTIKSLVGANGSVYVRIPSDGRGQVQVSHNDRTRTLEAISEDHVELESFTNIKVVKVVDPRTVSVRKL